MVTTLPSPFQARQPLSAYLTASAWIDFNDPGVADQARALAHGSGSQQETAQRCFEFVRDQIAHSGDHRRNPVTCRASEVLRHGTGYCYAKSHLLAALLRANGIAAGLCYQRLSQGTSGPPYCLHGLNALHLPGHGWYRIDARGNKPGVEAQFRPPIEHLAFAIREPAERDLPGIWAEPLVEVIDTLTRYRDVHSVGTHLPDISGPDSRFDH